MTTETLASTVITGYDATPPTKPAGGAGGAGFLQEVSGYLTTTSGKTTGSVYKFVRLRSDCYVKNVYWEAGADGSDLAWVAGLYYSDNPADFPSNPALAGTVIDSDFFATDLDNTAAVGITDITNQSGTYTADLRQQPLWQAAGLSSDPGGYFDVALTSGGTNGAADFIAMSVRFVTV